MWCVEMADAKELKKYLNEIAQLLVEMDNARRALDEIQERLLKLNAQYLKAMKD